MLTCFELTGLFLELKHFGSFIKTKFKSQSMFILCSKVLETIVRQLMVKV